MYNNNMKINDTKWFHRDKPIKIYCCGPTVYNKPHIGNLKPLVTSSYLINFLTLNKKNVIFVHNITDIDDKIIDKAMSKNVSELHISVKYTNNYMNIIEKLNIKKPDFMPNVTSQVKEISEYIKRLLDSGYAYRTARGNIYFSVNKIPQYGQLSNRENNDDYLIELNEEKLFPLDFALWKKSDKGVQWDFGLGQGRPGWHTECSYFIHDIFKTTCDIHLGGMDLKFPHHENENAQSIALNNEPITESWLHCGQLMVEGQKMSKSLGNFIYADDVIEERGPNFIKVFFALNNYNKPLNYGDGEKKQVDSILNKIKNSFNKYISTYLSSLPNDILIDNTLNDLLINDFNTSSVITFIEKRINDLNKSYSENNINNSNTIIRNILYYFAILGLNIVFKGVEEKINLIKEQKLLVSNKQFKEADELRNKISNLEVVII